MTSDAAATLKGIADIGYKEVEVIRTTLDKVGPLAKQDGLDPVSIHVDIPLIMTGTLPNGSTWRRASATRKPWARSSS